jgi:hypothetical protein
MNKELYKSAVDDIKVNEELIKELTIKMMNKQVRPKGSGKYGIIAAALAIVLLSAVFIQNIYRQNNHNKIVQLTAGDSIKLPKEKGTIYINKIEGINSAKLFIPEGAYTIEYALDELAEVFGRNPLPEMPKDFRASGNNTSIIFEPEGKILYMNPIIYSTNFENPEAPSINIKLNRDALPPIDCIYNTDNTKESLIGSTKVIIGAMSQKDEGNPSFSYTIYSAEFIHYGVGYNITANGTDGETFLNLLYSIIK